MEPMESRRVWLSPDAKVFLDFKVNSESPTPELKSKKLILVKILYERKSGVSGIPLLRLFYYLGEQET